MRDILIFPKFDNVDKINEIRSKYDNLYGKIDPHITLVFPFDDEISNEELIDKINNVIKDINKFSVMFSGVTLSDDNYIYLNCAVGSKDIIKLHDKLYKKILPKHLRSDIKYIPHITLGQSNNISEIIFNYIFDTTIDKIVLEEFGDDEVSHIIHEFNLK